jgi:hypothetical protein
VSLPITLPATAITPAILDTVMGHLAPHFLIATNGDLQAARDAAGHLLAAYNAETEAELSLAAEIVTFSFHALEALGEAAAPDLPLNKKLRLRGSAVSLSRESHKAQRKLDQLQRARLTPPVQSEPQTPPPPDKPGTDQALGLIEFARQALEGNIKTGGTPAWTPTRQQRRAAQRIAEKVKRNQAEYERREARTAAIQTAAIRAKTANLQPAA